MARFSGRKADLTPACHIYSGLHHVRLDMTITQKRVQELFDYHPDGKLLWKKRTGPRSNPNEAAGSLTPQGYLRVKFDKKNYLIHRLIYLWHTGKMPVFVDHKDQNKANNKIENLRPATKSQNNCNTKLRKDNKSGFCGVHWHKATNTWAAQINVNNQGLHIGLFDDKEKAAIAYNEAAIRLHGEFARLNKVLSTD
jgi:hypothetical protein